MQDVIKVPDMAPGCFGSAINFDADDMICRSCPFAKLCEPAHLRARDILRERHGIVVKQPLKKVPKAEPPPPPPLGPKGEAVVKYIKHAQIDVRELLRQKVNPFEDQPKFMKIACALLLSMGTVEPKMIEQEMAAGCGFDSKKAHDFTNLSVRVLQFLDVVSFAGGVVSLKEA